MAATATAAVVRATEGSVVAARGRAVAAVAVAAIAVAARAAADHETARRPPELRSTLAAVGWVGLRARLRLSRCFVKPSFAEALPTALTSTTTQTRLAPRPHHPRPHHPQRPHHPPRPRRQT